MTPRKPNSWARLFLSFMGNLLIKAEFVWYVALSGLVYAWLLRVSLPVATAQSVFWLLVTAGFLICVASKGGPKGPPPALVRAVLQAFLNHWPQS